MTAALRLTLMPPWFLMHARRGIPRSLSRSLTTTTTTATDAAQQMQRTFKNQTKTYRQTLDGHQLQKLSLTLNRPHLYPGLDITSTPPPIGTPLPPGYHLVYFAPAAVEANLAADGTDRTFNAPAPFTRRMWAGGRMRWTPGVALRVGETVEERTRLVGATAKRSRDGGEMVLVDVEKEFWGSEGLALVDRRSWVFRPPVRRTEMPLVKDAAEAGRIVEDGGGRRSSVEDVKGVDDAERRFNWTPVALFRFSALTFNAHMIHYSESWTRDMEGHPDVVVHGPLNLICMMDYFRDVHGKEAREISYRALSPLYAGDEYSIRAAFTEDAEEGKAWDIVVAKGAKVCMKGTVYADS
ncbi:Mesaconyl-C(4)-CoA hydratase [Cytospora mali]|uniref:Mesaconyl-C(4)-CoA hydratase n=1 Tax=Cytospora mali TaxID=578113 RepID=A0A194V7P2_CYTMA|nr:Mesaconyl-C(4)-CoA hydratase [Valsa mali var. pyri (nom. inval.)]